MARASRLKDDPVRDIPNHNCQLVVSIENVYKMINDGIFVQLRRKLRQLLTITPHHPSTFPYLKSSYQIDVEMKRHLRRFPNTIHPLSYARLYWECFMLFILLIVFFTIPTEVILTRNKHSWKLIYFKMYLDVICYIDIILFFCTGYIDHGSQKFILDPRKIAQKYALSFFFPDLLSSLPMSLIAKKADSEYLHFLKIFLLLKLLRYTTLKNYLAQFFKITVINSTVQMIIIFILNIAMILMYSTSIVVNFLQIARCYPYPSTHYNDQTPVDYIMETSNYVISLMYAVQQDKFLTKCTFVILMDVFWIFVGFVLNILMLAKIVEIYGRHKSKLNKHYNLKQQIKHYMRYKGLSPLIKQKIKRYVNFKFKSSVVKEDVFLVHLSTCLQQEIMMHNCKAFMEKVEFFRDLSTDVMLRIVTMFRMETFITNDIIFQAGVTGSTMYFIYFGKVAVFTRTNKEICHLEEGSHFGEISLLINTPRTATVVAVTECELYRLSRKDFLEAIAPFPELQKKMWALAAKRLKETHAISGDLLLLNLADHSTIDFTEIASDNERDM